jgi:hypothetical protein
MKKLLPLFGCLVLLAGCASISSHKGSTVKLDQLKRIFVEHRLAEENGIDRMIAEELTRLGHEASYGPLTMKPDKVDAILSYEERWGWDFRSYLIELRVELRDLNQPPTKLANARYFRPAITSALTPEQMVRTTLAKLFAAGGPR